MDSINTEYIDLEINKLESLIKKHYDDVAKISKARDKIKNEISKPQNNVSGYNKLYVLCEQEIKIVSIAMLCNIVMLDNYIIYSHLKHCNTQSEVNFFAKKICAISYEYIQTTDKHNRFLYELSKKYDLLSLYKDYASSRKKFSNDYKKDIDPIRNKAESHFELDFQEYYKSHISIYKINIKQMISDLYELIIKLKDLIELINKHVIQDLNQG